jgi:peptide chain release factor 1
VPPTEKRGRVQSSTVTVAVIDPGARERDPKALDRSDDAFEVSWFAGTGKGGQHRNKHQNCCRMLHRPTGIVRTATGRSRQANLRDARAALDAALDAMAEGREKDALDRSRRDQVGTGQRADKRRTYRARDNRAKDHLTGRQAPLDRVLEGGFDRLWR